MRRTIRSNHKLQVWVAIGLVCMVVGFSVGLAGLWANGRDSIKTDHRICARINVLDTALISILNRSLHGLPSNPYYREHPGQLVTALRNTRYALNRLEAARCKP